MEQGLIFISNGGTADTADCPFESGQDMHAKHRPDRPIPLRREMLD